MLRCSCTLLALLGLGAPAWAAAPLQVQDAAAPVAASAGVIDSGVPVDFGTTDVGRAVSKVFTVRNLGTEVLTLGGKVKLPKGFTLMRRFGRHVLAPGGTTSFTLALNPAAAGRLGGPVTLAYTGSKPGKATFLVAGSAFGPPSVRIVTVGAAGFETTGPWRAARPDGGIAATYAAAGGGANTAAWTFTGLRPGQYQVAVTWPAGADLASDARFTVHNGNVPFTAVPVNQKQPAADFQDAGTGWKVLGQSYRITGDRLTVRLTDQANGKVAAAAVRIARVGFPGAVLNPEGPGFSRSTKGAAAPTVRADGYSFTRLAAGSGQATWTFSGLVPGQYRVSVAWNPNPKGATRAPYTVLDDARPLATVSVDPRQAPADLVDGGRGWKDLGDLGTLYSIKHKTLMVSLNLAGLDGPVDVGPVRVERIYNPGAPPPGGGPDGTTYADAVRFLEQATWGPNDTEVNNVVSVGIAEYLTGQLTAGYTGFPVLPLPPDNQTLTCDPSHLMGEDLVDCQRTNFSAYPLQRAFFTNALYGPDQLRQRMAWALHKIWVVSGQGDGLSTPARMSYYLQVLDQNALGNYWDIMYGITLNPAMGNYLTMANSTKGSPNENYAREVLQLFTLGLDLLNPDGTPVLDDQGNPVPTYDQSVVVGFAKVFSGWTYAPPPVSGTTNYRDPMVVRLPEATYHDASQKTLLNINGQDWVNPAGLSAADDLFNGLLSIWVHPNLAPFVSKGLIQQLVTSNPSPEYVARVAQVFSDDGTGTQGNLAQVAVAILTDPEARGDLKDPQTDPNYGKLREPVQFVTNLLRAFNALSYDGTDYSDGYLDPQVAMLDQDVLRPPTVFGYFVPTWPLAFTDPAQSLVAPEFQLFTNVNAFRRINVVNQLFMVPNNYGIAPTLPSRAAPLGTRPDLSFLKALNDQDSDGAPYAMADYLNYLLLHGSMSSAMYGYLDGQGGGDGLVYAIYRVAAANSSKRAQTAAYLIGASSAYQVQR